MTESETVQGAELISIDTFAKAELRVAQIKEAKKAEGSKKLLLLQVEVEGGTQRQVVAGIGKSFEPESLIGRKIVIVANLKPATIMGHDSQGMLLASEIEGGINLVHPGEEAIVGSRIR